MGVRIVAVSDPTRPREIGSFNTPGYVRDVQLRNGLAYLADKDRGVSILNVVDPRNPFEEAVIDSPGSLYALRLAGTSTVPLVVAADGTEGIRTISVMPKP